MRPLTKKNLRYNARCSITMKQVRPFVPCEVLLLTKGQKQALLDGCCFAVKGTKSMSLMQRKVNGCASHQSLSSKIRDSLSTETELLCCSHSTGGSRDHKDEPKKTAMAGQLMWTEMISTTC